MTARPLSRVLVANRGEIARRVIDTCRQMDIETVAVYSDADADAPHTRDADEAVRLPGTSPAATYLDGALLVEVALGASCDAVHPGYGFLSENAAFARRVIEAGLIWIGPPPTAIESMGSKIAAKRLMRAAGVPVLPDTTVEPLAEVGFPALVKASAGGGGRGMRVVRTAEELDAAVDAATREAAGAFGDGSVFVERCVEGARHVEIQVFADTHGNVVSLFERDCTVQRRHQKIIEESPSPAVDAALRARMGDEAVAAARAVGYVGAGTVEFLLDRNGEFWFLEMNTRLQVEHPVTELVTGLDLVELQLRVAAGEPLPDDALRPSMFGHAIELRVCAEDPWNGYRPSSGRFTTVELPDVTGVIVDAGVTSGSVVSTEYDSMIVKLIAHGPTREAAVRRLLTCIDRTLLVGPDTNLDQLRQLLHVDPMTMDTTWVDRNPPHPRRREALPLAIAIGRAEHDRRTVLRHVPPGWRNNPAVPQQVRFGDTLVEYRRDRHGAITWFAVNGEASDEGWRGDAVERRAAQIVIIDGVAFWPGGARVELPDRYPQPDDPGRAGSLVSPMPGAVTRLDVAAGDVVHAGQALVAIEAMKMEHQVVSPLSGTVAEVFVGTGQQVTGGQMLVRIDAADDDGDPADPADPPASEAP